MTELQEASVSHSGKLRLGTEVVALLTGCERFIKDLAKPPDLSHAAILRSHEARAVNLNPAEN